VGYLYCLVMASSPAELPDLYRDPVNTARETRARFRFQDECVALRCIPNLVSGRITAIVVEWSSDYLMVAANGDVELVSIKHREPDQSAWTPSRIRPVLADLHAYWRAMDERCTCVFASSIGVSSDVTGLTTAALADWLDVSQAEAARFWQALRLPNAATVLPRRSEITAVGIRDLGGVLEHLDRDPLFAQQCYAALVTRIAEASIDEPATPAQRIARLSGSARAVLDRSGPDLAAQTLRLDDMRALVLATHDTCTEERAQPVVVRQVTQVVHAPDGSEWRGGTQIRAAGGVFLIHTPVTTEDAPDGSYVCRRAKARQLEPDDRDVWLIQLRLMRVSTVGKDRLAALRREADLLTRMSTVDHAPRLVTHDIGDASGTLVVAMAGARPLPEVFGPPGTPYPSLVLDALLCGLPPLLGLLAALHRLGYAHRALAPDNLLVADQSRIVPRDLGLAAVPAVPGEGPASYRAPEQDRPLLHPPGPHTDVYQLAAVLYHLATGLPAGPTPVPPSLVRPDLSSELDRALLPALDADIARRASLAQLRNGLRALTRAGGTAVMPS
jgi:hypothetical protein